MTTKMIYRYTKDTLLAFAKLPCCQSRPDGIDPVLWSDSFNSDVAKGNIAIPVVPSDRGFARRDTDLAHSKSPVDDLPEWRRPNVGGAILQSCPRRKPNEEEPLGNAFSISYPPRPSGPWVEHNGTQRPLYDRPGPNGAPGPLGRWDHNGDRDRERGRLPQNWDTDKRGPVSKGDAGQRPWVERDGLLGSGNRPAPPVQDRMGRPADNHHPSRPHIKTPICGRRDDFDIVNDETFGDLKSYTDDRSYQERDRRESFELMRKEQHRQLREHNRSLTNSENPIVNRKHDENSLWDNLSHQSPPRSPMGKVVVPSIPTPPRPTVPPGFPKVVIERLNSNQAFLQQEDDALGAQKHLSKDVSVKDHTLDSDKADDSSSVHSCSSAGDIKEVECATLISKEMNIELDFAETEVVVTEVTAVNGSLPSGESLSGRNSTGASDMWGFNAEGQDEDLIIDILSIKESSSIRKESLLDKLFANITPTIVDDVVLPSDLLKDEPLIAAPEEYNRAESISKTSKFAHWFPGEEDKFSISKSSRLKNFSSSLGNSEQTIYSTSLKKDLQSSVGLTPVVKVGCSVGLPIPVAPPSEDFEKGFAGMGEVPHTSEFTFSRNDCMGNSNAPSKQPFASVPVFMTCEDIEQVLLAEAAQTDTQLLNGRATPLLAAAETPTDDATSASQHLLALLLKRPPSEEAGLSIKALDVEFGSQNLSTELVGEKSEPSNNKASEVHTLESLFGKAFMNELQSSEGLSSARILPDEASTRQESELAKTSFSMQNGNLNHKLRSNGMDVPRYWIADSGPEWSSLWSNSEEVEAGGYGVHSVKESHLNQVMSGDFEAWASSTPLIPGLLGKTEATKTHNNLFMDGSNVATPNLERASFKQTRDNGVVKSKEVYPRSLMQPLGASFTQRNHQQTPLSAVNTSFPHPALRPQAQVPMFNSNGLDMRFDGFSALQHIQPSPHGFSDLISHPQAPLMAQQQIFQRPQLYCGMVMPEHDAIKPQPPAWTGSVHISSGHHMYGQHQQSQKPPSYFLSEVQSTNNNSTASGGFNGIGNIERWFENGGHFGPSNILPQAPGGMQDDLKLMY